MVIAKISPTTFIISSPLAADSCFRRNNECRLLDTEKYIEEIIANHEKLCNCTETSRRVETTYDDGRGIVIYTITCTFDSNK